jgi:hypothetical protein
MDVFQANDSFHFDKLQLTHPHHITGGSYMTRYSYCDSKQPLYIQTTKTFSKQGIVILGRKAHIDLLLTSNDIDAEFIEWITNLEKRSVDLLYEKRHLWFTQELDHNDIENSLTSPLRAYKTGNFLLRVNLEPNRNTTTHIKPFLCKVFDENKNSAEIEYIKAEHPIISIIEFHGIKFTSRNFQIELLLRQVLVIPDMPLFETCVIRSDSTQSNTTSIADRGITKEQNNLKLAENDLGLVMNDNKEEQQQENSKETELEGEKEIVDDSEKYITPSVLKHFECTEVDIDFKNIPDEIDINEPTFEVPKQTTVESVKQDQHIPLQTRPHIILKRHKDVLYEMYKVAKHKANEMKRAAIRAYLEAKEIKAKYLLDDLDDLHSDSSDDESKI